MYVRRTCTEVLYAIISPGLVILGYLSGTLSIFRPGTEHLRAKPASHGKREELLPVDNCCCRLSQGQVAGAYRFRCAKIQLPDLHRGAENSTVHVPASTLVITYPVFTASKNPTAGTTKKQLATRDSFLWSLRPQAAVRAERARLGFFLTVATTEAKHGSLHPDVSS